MQDLVSRFQFPRTNCSFHRAIHSIECFKRNASKRKCECRIWNVSVMDHLVVCLFMTFQILADVFVLFDFFATGYICILQTHLNEDNSISFSNISGWIWLSIGFYMALMLYQSCRNLEAKEIPNLRNQSAETWVETRTPCSASQELYYYTNASQFGNCRNIL